MEIFRRSTVDEERERMKKREIEKGEKKRKR